MFLTTAVTEGKSKRPQIGSEYSNVYVAELMKQGLSQQEVLDRVTARDIELPSEAYPIYLDFGTGASPALAGEALRVGHAVRLENAAAHGSRDRRARSGGELRTDGQGTLAALRHVGDTYSDPVRL